MLCSQYYTGPRCATCAVGAYRVRSECRACPNNAWLLIMVCSVGLLILVAASVYLTKKKVSLAALSIGVVRVVACIGLAC